MIQLERLAPEKFDELKTVADGFCPPKNSVVLLAKQDGQTVGRTMLLAPAHIEGTWILESARGGSVLLRLISGIESEAMREGIKELFAYSETKQVSEYLERLGYKKKPLIVYSKELPCR